MNFHGGNIYSYKHNIIDFSSNINPLGVPESFKEALVRNIDDFTKYPDIDYIELRNSIGEYLGVVSIDNILVGNGAVELIYRIIQQSGKSKLICPKPTFSEYSNAARIYGMQCSAVDAFKNEYNDIDTDLILKHADEKCIVVVCNPNNPTGTLINKSQIFKLAVELKKKGAILIVDEAFMEFTKDYPVNSLQDRIQELENTFIIKAATKYFGMPGIRLGYAISSNTNMINRIREGMEPWNINTAAVIAGCTVLKDTDYINRSKEWIEHERDFLYNGLNNIQGINVYPSSANFHLVKLRDDSFDAWRLKDKLLKQSILIRTPEGFEGLGGHFVRFAVKKRADNLLLLNALKEIYY